MTGLNKGIRFLMELLVVAVTLFVFLFGIGQLELMLGMTAEKTASYSFIMLVAHLILIYILLNETVYRWMSMKFFKRKKMTNRQRFAFIGIAIAILVYVYIMVQAT